VKTLILTAIAILSSLAYGASPSGEGNIIYISRKLKMSSLDATAPKDFYVDLGDQQGLKTGDVLEVYRVQPVLNGVTGDANNFVRVRLGELKIILLGEFSSIARIHTLADAKELPVLDYPAFMLGDVVAAKTSLPFDNRTP